MNKSTPTKHTYKHDPNLCQALNAYFNDAKAWGNAHLTHIKTVILAGVKS